MLGHIQGPGFIARPAQKPVSARFHLLQLLPFHQFVQHFIDDGPGFSDEVKSDLFEPFKSTKPGKGLGLGLNISYNIIHNHGGSIKLNENYHNGAHLIVNIPKGDKRNERKTNTFGN